VAARRSTSKAAPPPAGPLFTANPGPQAEFVGSTSQEILYGGRASGGKSAGLLIAAYLHLLRYGRPNSVAIIFRRTLGEVKSSTFYQLAMERFTTLAGMGVTFNKTDQVWDFGANGKLRFGYLEGEDDHLRYQGHEYIFIGFDEATHFRPKSLVYLISRLRGPAGVPCVLRLTSNPGGPHHKFVFERYAPWLNRRPEYLAAAEAGAAPLAAPGEVLWALTDPKTGKDYYVPEGTPGAESRTYIPAGVQDNPHVDQEEYRRKLSKLDAITRAQLDEGDWLAEERIGEIFKRTWFPRVRTPPTTIKRWIRSWDMAWGTSDSACWTVGLLMGEAPEGWYVADVIRLRATEGVTRPLVKRIAELDGRHVVVRLPDDSGKAGVDMRGGWVRDLAGFVVKMIPDKGDKFERAKPASSMAEHGKISLCDSHPSRDIAQELAGQGVEVSSTLGWKEDFMGELESLDPSMPKRGDKDQLDAFTAAFNYFVGEGMKELPPASALAGGQAAAARLWRGAGGSSGGGLFGGQRRSLI